MHQVSLKHRDEYFRGSTLIPAIAGTSLQDSDTPFRNSLPLWLTLSQIRFSVLTRGTLIFNVQYLVLLNSSLVPSECQELVGSGFPLSLGLFGCGSAAERNGICTFVSQAYIWSMKLLLFSRIPTYSSYNSSMKALSACFVSALIWIFPTCFGVTNWKIRAKWTAAGLACDLLGSSP